MLHLRIILVLKDFFSLSLLTADDSPGLHTYICVARFDAPPGPHNMLPEASNQAQAMLSNFKASNGHQGIPSHGTCLSQKLERFRQEHLLSWLLIMNAINTTDALEKQLSIQM